VDHHTTGHPAGFLPDSADTTCAGALARWLRCPHCGEALLPEPSRTLHCRSGHSFDIARQGYASLLTGHRRHRGDEPAMVTAREQFLARDHYRPLRSTITALAAEHAPVTGEQLVADLAGGTGHYLASVLDALPGAVGLVVEVSTAALRRAARAHPRASAIAADLRGTVPLASGAAAVVLSVFGPRPTTEITRLLRRDGILILATARPGHLDELRPRFATLEVDPRKDRRLRASFAEFDVLDAQTVEWRLALDRRDIKNLVAMGPAGHHLDEADLDAAVASLPAVSGVSAAMSVTVLRHQR
jgi:23S rRNA (guanine745-N1)-methyltransferase